MGDRLWAVTEPLLPAQASGTPSPVRMDGRLVLQKILFVLFTGVGWEDLPQESGLGRGMTCWRRLRDWQSGGCSRPCTRRCRLTATRPG
ncbi:transposase [Nocardia fluminea]|uniref:transposase n=1 Tax=Nocardia fluminea TaxID=134984 RepID=UPI00341406D0